MLNKDWELIYKTDDSFKAHLVKTKLTDLNIECVLINKKDSTHLVGSGEMELYVKVENALIALNHLNSKDEY